MVEVWRGGYAANWCALVSELCGAQDEVGTSSALQKYAEMDVQFTDTREYKLLRDIQAAQEEALPTASSSPLHMRRSRAQRRPYSGARLFARAGGGKGSDGQEDRMDARLVDSSCGVIREMWRRSPTLLKSSTTSRSSTRGRRQCCSERASPIARAIWELSGHFGVGTACTGVRCQQQYCG
jgi:hypothetical protein